MITENSSGFDAKSKRIQNVAAGTLTTDIINKGQLEDGSLDVVFDDVTVNGVLSAGALSTDSVAPAITAKAGGGQDATLALSKNLNIVTIVATAADSVTLPAAVVGLRITIVNLGANAIAVFPYTSDSINDEVADASITQQPETTVTYNCYTGTLWESDNESLQTLDYLYVTNLMRQGLTGVITAFAGGGQASATALTKQINNVSTVATNGDSVKLMAAEQGLAIVVKNSGVADLDIFPADADSIDALAVNLAVRINPGSTAIFYAKSTTVWESNVDASLTLVAPSTNKGQLRLLAADSAGNTVSTITNASQTTTAVWTVPDTNGNANFVMTAAAQSIGGVKTFTDTTASTSKDTGAVVVEGGMGIEKELFIGLTGNTAGVHTFGSGNVYKALTTQTALAGGAQAGTALTAEYTNFTVVATAGDSVQLPTPVLGTRRVVTNSATSKLPMAVFGQTGASIDNGAADASVLIGYGETVVFEAISATEWKTRTGSMNIASGIITEERTISATEIVGTAAGDLGHANGVELVAAAGSGYALEFISAIAIYDFDTAAYTGGGNDTTINLGSGGAAITGVVTSANLLGAAGDKIVRFDPLSTAALPVSVGVGISMNSITAWTQPGTAAGVLRVQTSYRIHRTGL